MEGRRRNQDKVAEAELGTAATNAVGHSGAEMVLHRYPNGGEQSGLSNPHIDQSLSVDLIYLGPLPSWKSPKTAGPRRPPFSSTPCNEERKSSIYEGVPGRPVAAFSVSF